MFLPEYDNVRKGKGAGPSAYFVGGGGGKSRDAFYV